MNNKKTTNSELPLMIMSFLGIIVLVGIVIAFFFVVGDFAHDIDNNETTKTDVPVNAPPKSYIPITNSNDVIHITADEINAKNAILINLNTNTVIAQIDADKRIFPASMTKVMTLLVAVENIENINDTFEMTNKIIDPLWREGATRAGFVPGDVPLIDLLYGAILPSGADATVALAQYVTDSETEAEFVKLMNQKAVELGLVNTNFVNSSGLYNVNHYSTVRDIATIMACAIENPLCKQILCATEYRPSAEIENTSGMLYSRWHGNLKGDEPTGVVIKGAKTGYEILAGHSMVSYAVSMDGKTEYILVTAHGAKLSTPTQERPLVDGKMQPIYDLKYIYSKHAK